MGTGPGSHLRRGANLVRVELRDRGYERLGVLHGVHDLLFPCFIEGAHGRRSRRARQTVRFDREGSCSSRSRNLGRCFVSVCHDRVSSLSSGAHRSARLHGRRPRRPPDHRRCPPLSAEPTSSPPRRRSLAVAKSPPAGRCVHRQIRCVTRPGSIAADVIPFSNARDDHLTERRPRLRVPDPGARPRQRQAHHPLARHGPLGAA